MTDEDPYGLDAARLARLLRGSGARVIGDVWTDSAGAALALGVDPRTIYNWRIAKIGPPAYQPGRRLVLYLIEDIAQHLRNSVVTDVEDEAGSAD